MRGIAVLAILGGGAAVGERHHGGDMTLVAQQEREAISRRIREALSDATSRGVGPQSLGDRLRRAERFASSRFTVECHTRTSRAGLRASSSRP